MTGSCRIPLLNICVDNVTMAEAVSEADRLIRSEAPCFSVTPNVDYLVRLEKDPKLREVFRHADLILTDGMPLVWISHLKKNPVKEKVSGSDFFPHLTALCEEKGYSMYLFGGEGTVPDKAKERLLQSFPGLRIAGTSAPPPGFEKDASLLNTELQKIRDAAPDVLIVCLGCPKQEYLIHDYLDTLQVPFSIGLGATLDFVSGKLKRAPAWMSSHGLEWLYRITQDPGRMLKRYTRDLFGLIRLLIRYRDLEKQGFREET